jgi:hypothetical protein
MAFTVPVDPTARTGRPARCGNCMATNRLTSPGPMSTSPSCIFMRWPTRL